MERLLRYGFIGILLPLLVQYIVYFQYTTNYTTNAFSEKGFMDIYDTKVYKSRQLGKALHLWAYHKLSSVSKMKGLQDRRNDETNPLNSRRLTMMDPAADPVFYLTYFLIAAAFTIGTSLFLLLLFDDRSLFPDSFRHKDLVVALFVLLVGLTQFVVTPYDTISYCFQAVAMLFFLKYLENGNLLHYAGLLFLVVLSTFNRESSLLIVSFVAALLFRKHGFNVKFIRAMILPAMCFLVPYLFLKLGGGGAEFTDENKLSVNLDIRNSYAIRGLAFGAMVLYLLLVTFNRNRTPLVKYFLIFSLPYLLMIHAVGVMVEYRLWMPVVEGGIVLGLLGSAAEERSRTEQHGQRKKVAA